MSATGKWCQPDVPHKGWTCIGVEDLGEPSATCEMCEVQEIRYVHDMEHPDYPEVLGCGCICAGYMEEDYAAAAARERGLKNQAGRRKRWLGRQWKRSRKGNQILRTNGYLITIFPKSDDWSFSVYDQHQERTYFAEKPYPTSDRAKLVSFDAMVFLNQRKVSRRPQEWHEPVVDHEG